MEQASRLPPHGAVTGWASLRLAGGAYFDGLEPDGRTEIPVPLAVGPSRDLRQGQGASVSFEPIDPCEVVVRQGVQSLSVERALFDEMRRPGDPA